MNQKTIVLDMILIPQIYIFNTTFTKIPKGCLAEIDRLTLKLIWKCKRSKIIKKKKKKKRAQQTERLMFPISNHMKKLIQYVAGIRRDVYTDQWNRMKNRKAFTFLNN